MNLRRITVLTLLALGLAAPFIVRAVTYPPVPKGSPYVIFEAINDTVSTLNSCDTTQTDTVFLASTKWTAESTAVIAMKPGERIAVMARLVWPNTTDSMVVQAFAMQVRAHLPFYQTHSASAGTGVAGVAFSYAAADTQGPSGSIRSEPPLAPSDSTSMYALVPWVVNLTTSNMDTIASMGNQRTSGISATTWTPWHNLGGSKSILNLDYARRAWTDERVITFRATDRAGAISSAHGSLGANLYFPLTDARGVDFWAPYFSLRFRSIAGSATAAQKPRLIVHIVKFPSQANR